MDAVLQRHNGKQTQRTRNDLWENRGGSTRNGRWCFFFYVEHFGSAYTHTVYLLIIGHIKQGCQFYPWQYICMAVYVYYIVLLTSLKKWKYTVGEFIWQFTWKRILVCAIRVICTLCVCHLCSFRRRMRCSSLINGAALRERKGIINHGRTDHARRNEWQRVCVRATEHTWCSAAGRGCISATFAVDPR